MTRIFLSILAATALFLGCAKKPPVDTSVTLPTVTQDIPYPVTHERVHRTFPAVRPAPTPVFADVRFGFNSSTPLALTTRIASWLRTHPNAHLLVAGYADTVGSSRYNMKLSLKRAEAVREALVKAGIPTDRIATFAMGEIGGDPAAARKVTIQVE